MNKNSITDRNFISHVKPQKRVLRGTFVATAIAIAGAGLSTFGMSSAEAAVLSADYNFNSTGAVNPPFGGNWCADVAGGNPASQTKVQIQRCHAAPNQQFELNGQTIYALGGQRCLDVVNNGTIPGSNVQSYTCTGGTNQQWYYDGGRIVNYKSNLCLSAKYLSAETQLTIENCDNSVRWQIK